MSTTYKDRLERELAKIRQVALDFEAAIRVDNLLNGRTEDAPKVLELRASLPVKTEKPSTGPITIRKIAERKPAGEVRRIRDGLRASVLGHIRERGPCATGALIERFDMKQASKYDKQQLYQTLYEMKASGELLKDDRGVFSFADAKDFTENSVPPPAS